VPLQRDLLRLARGHDAEAVQALTEVIAASTSSGDAQALGYAEWALAERDLLQGDYAGALLRLEVALAHTGRIPLDVSLLSLRAWAELLAGDFSRAEATLSQAREIANEAAERLGLVDVERIHGLLMTLQHRWMEAECALQAGMELARGMPYPYAEAKTLYLYGQLHAAKGEPAQAHERYEQALAILDRLGEGLYRPCIEQALAEP
jgi:tetratricopeptide (TPR) repeat protein